MAGLHLTHVTVDTWGNPDQGEWHLGVGGEVLAVFPDNSVSVDMIVDFATLVATARGRILYIHGKNTGRIEERIDCTGEHPAGRTCSNLFSENCVIF